MTVKLKSGKTFEGTVITKALNVLVFKTDAGRYLLISRYSIENDEDFKFKE